MKCKRNRIAPRFMAVALPALLCAVPALAQPTRPAICADFSSTATYFQSVSSDSAAIDVTFVNPDPVPSEDGTFTICGPFGTNGAYVVDFTKTEVPASNRAGSTVRFGPDYQTVGGANRTLAGETDYWISFGDGYSGENPWIYVRTGKVALTVSAADVNKADMRVEFNRDLGPAALEESSFTVKKTPQGGTEETVGVSNAGPTANRVVLTLAAAVGEDDVVTVSYAKPASGTNNKIVDKRGVEAESFTDQPVINTTSDGGGSPPPPPPPGGGDPPPPPGGGDPPPDTEPEAGSDVTWVAPYWSRFSGGFVVEPAPGRSSVEVECGSRTAEYEAEDGLVVRLVRSRCSRTGLRITGAAPGGWYWQHGDRNAAVAPLVRSDQEFEGQAVVPGGVMADVTDAGTWISHDTSRLVGIVPHLAGNQCEEYVTPYWQGHGGIVARPVEGRDTVRVKVQCGRTFSSSTFEAGADGVVAALVRRNFCTDQDGTAKQGRLTVTGAAPGGWYWIDGERNAAVAPLMCSNLLGGPAAKVPGGVEWQRTDDGTFLKHDAEKLIGVVPHLGEDDQ